jgi:hypothetical protein
MDPGCDAQEAPARDEPELSVSKERQPAGTAPKLSCETQLDPALGNVARRSGPGPRRSRLSDRRPTGGRSLETRSGCVRRDQNDKDGSVMLRHRVGCTTFGRAHRGWVVIPWWPDEGCGCWGRWVATATVLMLESGNRTST